MKENSEAQQNPTEQQQPESTVGGFNPPPTQTETVAVVAEETPRKIAGLVAGRIVNYVMEGGVIRPLIVVEPWDGTGTVNGVLLFDGTNDAFRHVRPLVSGPSGFVPECARWITSVHFSEGGEDGTWHWPAKQPVVAAAVDGAAMQTVLAAFEAKLLETVNLKLQANMEAVNDLLNAHGDIVTGKGSVVAGLAKSADGAVRSVDIVTGEKRQDGVVVSEFTQVVERNRDTGESVAAGSGTEQGTAGAPDGESGKAANSGS